MRTLIVIILLFSLGAACRAQESAQIAGPGVIVYAPGGAFTVSAPAGWVADRETGQKLGVCCVFYPAGTSWNEAEAIMYPEIVEKNARHATLRDFMAFDLEQFRRDNPDLTFEDSGPLPCGTRTAVMRLFHGVNKGSSEAVAYIDELKTIAVLVLSAKTQKALNDSLPVFRRFVRSYAFMDVRFTKTPD